ncbi:MAG: amidohydrolase [Proteobacteria bacterium]|nr:amidohydrolase [Pseudomonadota bacterium]
MAVSWLAAFTAAPPAALAANPPDAADTVYVNGYVYSVDSHDGVYQALAVRDGRIVYVGDDAGARKLAGAGTHTVDLHGRMLMPGLVDGHMHPLEGGMRLVACNLDYLSLTVPQFQARIQACLDKSRGQEPDGWLVVTNWFQYAMLPAGLEMTHAVLDSLHTRRPIAVEDSFGHTTLGNARALQLAGITRTTPDPLGGRMHRQPDGTPTGLLEDAAAEMVQKLIPPYTASQNAAGARAALDALRRQGVTSFLDALAEEGDLQAFSTVQHAGGLTARGHFAVPIRPATDLKPAAEAARVRAIAGRFDQGPRRVEPTVSVHNAKLFMDGVITAPALTGAMLEPYFVNKGTAAQPHWVPGSNRGPPVYFPAPQLRETLLALARAGIEPHMHADGDRAVREALDAVQAMRREFPEERIRAAIAHDESVDPSDFPRFKALGAVPVLSYQWEKPAADTIEGARDFLGPARFKYMEPAGYLAAAGARIAYGSDWPVDRLDEWFAMKVGVTRENSPEAGRQYAGRLGSDAGLTLAQAIRGFTANAAWELHAEHEVGSLEVGKFADLIVLDRNVFKVPPQQIADVKVLLTVVGGKTVFAARDFAAH